MELPTIHICDACSQRKTCSNKLKVNYSFLNWEKYKSLFLPSSQTKRCDIIFNKDNIIFFIELKSKDWFNENKNKSIGDNVLENIVSDLKQKIICTYNEYNMNINSTQYYKNIFSVVFSKQMSSHWDGDVIPSSLILNMLRMRVFPKFPEFNFSDNSFIHNNTKIFLDARECTHIDILLNI